MKFNLGRCVNIPDLHTDISIMSYLQKDQERFEQ